MSYGYDSEIIHIIFITPHLILIIATIYIITFMIHPYNYFTFRLELNYMINNIFVLK